MRIIILLLALLTLPCLSFSDDSKKEGQKIPTIEIGMQHSQVDRILEKSKWKKLDEKTLPSGNSTKTIITYRFGSKSLTYLESKIVLTYLDDKLINIDQYDLKNNPLKKDLERVYVW